MILFLLWSHCIAFMQNTRHGSSKRWTGRYLELLYNVDVLCIEPFCWTHCNPHGKPSSMFSPVALNNGKWWDWDVYCTCTQTHVCELRIRWQIRVTGCSMSQVSNSSPGGPLCLLVSGLFSAPWVLSSNWLAKEWTRLGMQALIDSWLLAPWELSLTPLLYVNHFGPVDIHTLVCFKPGTVLQLVRSCWAANWWNHYMYVVLF